MIVSQKQFAELVANQFGGTAKAMNEAIECIKREMTSQLSMGNKVRLTGFGTFETFTRHERGGVDPQNPDTKIIIPEVRVAKFRKGSMLKKALK